MAFAVVFPDLLKQPSPLVRRFAQLIDEENGLEMVMWSGCTS
jgi:hypothetical protein